MILPISPYGQAILRKQSREVSRPSPVIEKLLDDMWETMRNARGCGLAANQVGAELQAFIIDSKTTYEALDPSERNAWFDKSDCGITETFLNAKIIDTSALHWTDEEGCLSMPGITASISRPWSVSLRYHDRDFEDRERSFHGTTARMILHELDHTQGRLLIDHVSPLERKLLRSKLNRIESGRFNPAYPMRRMGG